MATIKSFRASRPAKGKVHLVPTKSVVTYSPKTIDDILDSNPFSFLHIIKPEHHSDVQSPPNSPELFHKIKEKFHEFKNDETFIEEEKPALYIYKQIKEEATYCGIISAISIDDYIEGRIKIHEQTISKREQVFKQYLEICNFNAEPVLLTYPGNYNVDSIIDRYTSHTPEYDFLTDDDIRHQLWVIDTEDDIQSIQNSFGNQTAVYIADGHHRTSSSTLLGLSRREKNIDHIGTENYNFFMAYFIPEHQLDIYDFNRVVKGLNGLSEKEFLSRVSKVFDVEKKFSSYKPSSMHSFGMYINKTWYGLKVKPSELTSKNPVDELDSHILTKLLLEPILGIKDLKTDRRIKFIGGLDGYEALEESVDSEKYNVAFNLFPVSIGQLKHIADTGNIMPPKTTWIEPKLRSGLLIYNF